jgi:hypothetical protein
MELGFCSFFPQKFPKSLQSFETFLVNYGSGNDMVNACNMVTSHCSVKHTSFTTETAQVADLPEMVGPSEVAGGRPERPVEIQCEISENPPPLYGETSSHETTPPNLADHWLTLTLTTELSTFPAYWSVRLVTQFSSVQLLRKQQTT